MNRREFLHYMAITAALVGMPRVSGQAQVPEIAFTFDDPTTEGGGNLTWREVNARQTVNAAGLPQHVARAYWVAGGKLR
jgi:hypothetical protein